MVSMKRLLLFTVAVLLASGALASKPAAACLPCDWDCALQCQAAGFDDGVCSPQICGGCVCLKW
jgi:hypothetical protein